MEKIVGRNSLLRVIGPTRNKQSRNPIRSPLTQLIAMVGDCEVGKMRKAHNNCTCRRAEAETKVQLGPTVEQLDNPQSACSSYGLGDVFCCSTCPYKVFLHSNLVKRCIDVTITLSEDTLKAWEPSLITQEISAISLEDILNGGSSSHSM